MVQSLVAGKQLLYAHTYAHFVTGAPVQLQERGQPMLTPVERRNIGLQLRMNRRKSGLRLPSKSR